MFTFEPAPTSEIWDNLINCQENIIKMMRMNPQFVQAREEFYATFSAGNRGAEGGGST